MLNVFPTTNGGTIKLFYMQFYVPTTLALACDFWLLCYTFVMEDGSLMVCERSLKKNTRNGPSIPPVHHFVTVEMLSGSYLIRPCGGGFFLILNRWGIGSLLASQGSKIMDTMHGHPLMHHPKGQVFVCFFF